MKDEIVNEIVKERIAMQHTLGPWRTCGGQNGECRCGITWSIPGDFPVCTVNNGKNYPVAVAHEHMADALDIIYQSISPEMCRANANLIAAAPDMLEALIAVVRVADRKTDEFDAARAAIAKALGKAVIK